MARIALDLAVALISLLAAWYLRVGVDWPTVRPLAYTSLPMIVVIQLGAVLLSRAYGNAPTVQILRRFITAALLGTTAATIAVWLWYGRLSLPVSVSAGAFVLFAMGGSLWRSTVAVIRLARARASAPSPPGMEPAGGQRSLLVSANDLMQYVSLARHLVRRDLKLKYRGSALGFLVSLLNPLVMAVVYTVAFKYMLRIAKPGFAFQLLVGLLAWTFFAASAGMSTGTIVDSGGLLKSVYFPRSILPLSTVLFNLSQYLLTMAVFLPIMLVVTGSMPAAPMLAFPGILLLQTVFTLGVALMLSSATAIYRDVKHLTEIGLSMLFWLTPVVYALSDIHSPSIKTIIGFTPLTPFISAYQNIFIDHVWPSASTYVVAAIYAVTMLTAGATLFFSLEDRFAEQI